jgi:DNA-binding transcriptional regulator YiaG
MPREIDWETRIDAEELYVVDGLTYEQVSERTGVSVTQLQRWGTDGGWVERRREYRNALGDIRRNTVKLRQALIESALNSLDPQAVYAVARLESATRATKSSQPDDRPVAISKPIETSADAVAALKVALEQKINMLLSKPGSIDLKAIKDLKSAMELLERMESDAAAENAAGENKTKTLSPERVREIRDQLGI